MTEDRKPPAHHDPAGGFRNPWPGAPPPDFPNMGKWLLAHRNYLPFPRDPPASAFEIVAPDITERVAADHTVLTWLGHATFLIQVGGLNILTDPMWGPRAAPFSFSGPRRHTPPPLPFSDLPEIDVVLLSHNHYDHLESDTIRALAARFPQAIWFVPLRLGGFVTSRGGRDVRELDWWQEDSVGDLRVTATPAQHFSRRSLFDRYKSLWCGYALATPQRRIYFAGDSAYFPEFPQIGSRLGPFDAALMPIGAYEPRPFMHWVHMNPEESVQAFQDLFARTANTGTAMFVPMHWGTYKLTIEALDEPPRRLRDAWHAAGLAPERLRVLKHGESLKWGPRKQ